MKGNKGIIFLIPLFFLFCYSPYKFLLREFKIDSPEQEQSSNILLYSHQENSCFEYEIIINTPLAYPFLPSSERFYFDYDNKNLMLQNYFLWVRVYIKNKIDKPISIDINHFMIKQSNNRFNPMSISELVIQHPLYLNNIPLFWYTLPKEPILYFNPSSDWLKSFYYKPFNIQDREYKLKYYQNYFDSYSKILLEPQKEILFFLMFTPLRESDITYHFFYENKQCGFEIPFTYKIVIKEEPLNIFDEEKYLKNILNQLEKRNIAWQKELKERLKKHDFKELERFKFF